MNLGLELAGAIWLGLLTTISPCPLASNIAAVSYVGKRVDNPGLVLSSGLIYAAGRTAAYVLVALLAVQGALSISGLSNFLQREIHLLVGPLLIFVGLLLLEVVSWPWARTSQSRFFDQLQKRADALGLGGAALLGFVFALAFCPVSAALFFGSLVPLAIQHESPVLLPSVYGLGTALPVIGISFLLAFSANRLSRAFRALTLIELWMRRITGVVFVLVGGYYCFLY